MAPPGRIGPDPSVAARRASADALRAAHAGRSASLAAADTARRAGVRAWQAAELAAARNRVDLSRPGQRPLLRSGLQHLSSVASAGPPAGPHPVPSAGPASAFHPAPAPRYSPPPPPVPGTSEFARSQARQAGVNVGAEWGSFEAEVRRATWTFGTHVLTREDRLRLAQNVLEQAAELPYPEEPDDPDLAAYYRDGFEAGFGSSYTASIGFAVAVVAAGEYIKYRKFPLPSLKWGRWAGAVGNSKFPFNDAGKAKFGLGGLTWVRFAKGKADFSGVAVKVNGMSSFRVPGVKGKRWGDRRKAVAVLAKQWGKSEPEVRRHLADNRLELHHYKGELMQLVPENYHGIAHQGSVPDLRALAAMGGTAGTIYALLADFVEGG